MRPLLWIGSAAVAAGAALFAVCLTRVFSFVYSANSVFLLTGLAASGLAVGALIAHRLCWLPGRALSVAWTGAALGAGFLVVDAAVTIGAASANPTIANVLLAYGAFAGIGAALAGGYALRPLSAASLFAAQALGAGVAALAVSLVLDRIGPIDAWLGAALVVAAGALVLLAAALAGRTRQAKDVDDLEDEGAGLGRAGVWVAYAASALSLLAAFAALPMQVAGHWLDVDAGTVDAGKPLFLSIRDDQLRETLVDTRWTSVSRSDVTEPANSTQVKWVYQDAEIAGLLYQTGTSGTDTNLQGDIANLPFQLSGAHDKVLVIGAGTGEEVTLALAAGAKEVVAAEPDLGVLAAARKFSTFGGDWLDNPAVRLVPQDGRTYLRASGEQFDVIYLALPASGAAQPGGPVTGSYLYTIDAFDDYADHLRQDGRLVLKLHDEQEFTRAFNSAFQASVHRGSNALDALRRMLAINDQPVADRGDQGISLPLLIVRKTPYLQDEIQAAVTTLQSTPYTPIFVPFAEQDSPFAGFADESYGPAFFEDRAPYDIRPVADSSPFFFEFGKGFPWVTLFAPLLPIALAGIAAWLLRRPTAEAIESVPDAPEEALAFLEDDVPWRFAAFVALAAAGFALAQEALLQRLPLLLGDVRLVVPIGYGSLLVAAAVGAVLGSRVHGAALRPAIGWAGLFAGIVAVAAVELLPMAGDSIRGHNPLVPAGVGAAFAVPLGLCLGVPFPSALRLLAGAGHGGWAPFLFAAAVLGGVLGVFLSVTLGIGFSFNYSFVLGGLCLFAAFMMAGLRYIRAEPREEAFDEPEMAVDHSQFQRPAETVG